MSDNWWTHRRHRAMPIGNNQYTHSHTHRRSANTSTTSHTGNIDTHPHTTTISPSQCPPATRTHLGSAHSVIGRQQRSLVCRSASGSLVAVPAQLVLALAELPEQIAHRLVHVYRDRASTVTHRQRGTRVAGMDQHKRHRPSSLRFDISISDGFGDRLMLSGDASSTIDCMILSFWDSCNVLLIFSESGIALMSPMPPV